MMAACLLKGASAQQFVVEGSTLAKQLDTLEEVAKQGDSESLGELFDGASRKSAFQVAAAGVAGFFGKGAASVGRMSILGLKLGDMPAVSEVVSNEPAKKHCCLDKMQSAEDGTLYRAKTDRPWWKFWDSSKAIQKSIPGQEGALFNEKGEFVGEWETVLKTKTDVFRVVTGADKANHIYTFERKGSAHEVARDGKYITSLATQEFREARVGRNDKLYALYQKGREDVIYSWDPATKQQKTEARIEADYKTWQTWIDERGFYRDTGFYRQEPGYYEETPGYYHPHEGYDHWHEGDKAWHEGEKVWVDTGREWVVTEPGHYETRVDRQGVAKFEVGRNGEIRTLFKGEVVDESTQKLLTRSGGRTSDFKIDNNGNLYTVKDGRLSVNGSEPGLQVNSGKLEIDDNGNYLKVDGQIIRRYNVVGQAPSPASTAAGK
ncbi:MAG: hypothetical protein HY554_13060 [Elusimicrobia bacterium]|nr:hypothetical protein [Elusimicrobiota bacterium]